MRRIGTSLRPVGQSALGEGLDSPSHSLEQEGAVAGAGDFAEDLQVTFPIPGWRV